jgi:hypothetical protein
MENLMRETADNISKAAYPPAASFTDSEVTGAPKKCGPAEEARRKNSAHRDFRTALGKGKAGFVEIE